MRTRNLLSVAAAGKPATGGSGGGPNDATWTEPEPPHYLGMNSIVAYGANVQIACPLNFQMAFGSNLQICINPSSFLQLYGDGASPVSPLLTALLGGGAGGNMQLTMGTSANVVMGQVFDINLGPKRITIDVHNKAGIQPCCKTLGTLLWVTAALALIAYALPIPDLNYRHGDDQRSITLMVLQAAMQALLTLLMNLQSMYDKMDKESQGLLDGLFGYGLPDCAPRRTFLQAAFSSGNCWVWTVVIVVGMLTPILLEAIGEANLPNPGPPEPPQPGDVVDSQGNVIGHETGGEAVVDDNGKVIGHET